jgi:hypothetical protein
MRKAVLAMALIVTGMTLSGCWRHGHGYDRPGNPSDHHHHHGY